MDRVAILLVSYRRPEFTALVLDQIEKYQANRGIAMKLYFFVDGPKEGATSLQSEFSELAQRARRFAEVASMFPAKNLGLKRAVPTAISWAFEKEENLIILEDDCVPAQGFFDWAIFGLGRFRNEESVFAICGTNLAERKFPDAGYFRSEYMNVWGWATWKSRWQTHSAAAEPFRRLGWHIRRYLSFGKSPLTFLWFYFANSVELASTWDYQLALTVAGAGKKVMCPPRNLISNIGSTGGTHSSPSYWLHRPIDDSGFEFQHLEEEGVSFGVSYDREVLSQWMGRYPGSSLMWSLARIWHSRCNPLPRGIIGRGV